MYQPQLETSLLRCHPCAQAHCIGILRPMEIRVRCTKCGEGCPPSPHQITCDRCSGPLEVAPETPIKGPFSISLGEGDTPVVHLEGVGGRLGIDALFAKLEFLNPTGSFKDRGSTALISILKEYNVRHVAEDSSGNAGASIAAYCAKAGIEATIFAPASAPVMKLEQIAFYGANVKRVEGGREAVTQACRRYCLEQGVVYASHNLSPYFIEGTKSFAYEVSAQLDPPPDHILFPVGNGSLLIGAWKGYAELTTANRTSKTPRLHCVQSRACMPIVAAFKGGRWSSPAQGVSTVAGGIAVERPPRLQQCLAAMKESGGTGTAVMEEDIILWQRRLAQEEGLFVEPTSAAALAGLALLVEEGVVKRDDRVLLPLTGSGLKDRIPSSP